MELLQAVIMGIVQGLSEFLPISSSAHLVFSSNLCKILGGLESSASINQEVFLDIMLHLGTLIAVLIFFRKDITEILKSVNNSIQTKDYHSKEFKTGMYIIIGTLLTALVAVPLIKVSEYLITKPEFVGIALIITGFILLISEYISKKYTEKKEISFKTSVLIGLAQGLASIPGFSRSGLTISAGLLNGAERAEAAKYSFLLSIPVILGASIIYPIFTLDIKEIQTFNITAIIIGTIISGIVGYLCIKYFLKFVSKFSLAIFGYYCLVIGILASVFFTVIK